MTLTELLAQHIELWDDDCREHHGCSCGSDCGLSERGRPDFTGDTPFQSAHRELWRVHLAEVIEASHSVTKHRTACRWSSPTTSHGVESGLITEPGFDSGTTLQGPEAQQVLDTVLAEINVNAVASDVHTAEDIAADVAQRLYAVYRVHAWDDGEPGPLNRKEPLP